MRSRWAQLALGLAGLAALAWAVVIAANPVITCREQVMAPGQTCANADGTKTQTYEQRFQASQAARPVIGTLGAATVLFAWTLHRGVRRRAQDSSDIGP